ncbi:MAG: glycosyltransferase [Candidatus Altiarchaeota archaeon]
MRILYLTRQRFLPPEDREGEVDRNIVARMVSRGHEVTVLAPHELGEEEVKQVQTRHNIRLIRFIGHGASRSPTESLSAAVTFCILASFKLLTIRLTERYDIVFLSDAPAVSPAMFIRRLDGSLFAINLTDFISRLSGRGGKGLGFLGRALFRLECLSISMFDLAFAPSPQMKMLLVQGGCTPSKLHVAYSGVDTCRFSAQSVDDKDVGWIRMECGIERRIILYNGSLEGGISDRFKAIAEEVLSANNDVTFLIFGEGSSYGRLKSEIQSDNVKFVGPMPPDLYMAYVFAANAGLVLTDESFENEYRVPPQIFEYLSIGLPVASTGSRAISELFRVHDFIRLSDSPKELANFLIELIDRPKSDDAVNLVRERHSWEAIATNITEIVELKAGKNSM